MDSGKRLPQWERSGRRGSVEGVCRQWEEGVSSGKGGPMGVGSVGEGEAEAESGSERRGGQ